MDAYKFLTSGAVGLFSGFAWPRPEAGGPGAWVEVDGPLAQCTNGVHACRAADLPYWLTEELWRVELEGDVVEGTRSVVARRARLTARIEPWDGPAAAEFAAACVLRGRDRAVRALEDAGETAGAGAVGGLETPGELAPALDAAAARLTGREAHVARYAAEAATYARSGLPSGDAAWASCTAYVSALLAGYERSGDPDRARRNPAYEAERRWQARWLANRLALPEAESLDAL